MKRSMKFTYLRKKRETAVKVMNSNMRIENNTLILVFIVSHLLRQANACNTQVVFKRHLANK